MKLRFVVVSTMLLVLCSWMLAACGNDKPPMVPDPDTTSQGAQPDAATD